MKQRKKSLDAFIWCRYLIILIYFYIGDYRTQLLPPRCKDLLKDDRFECPDLQINIPLVSFKFRDFYILQVKRTGTMMYVRKKQIWSSLCDWFNNFEEKFWPNWIFAINTDFKFQTQDEILTVLYWVLCVCRGRFWAGVRDKLVQSHPSLIFKISYLNIV